MLMSEVNVEEKVEETMDSAGSIQEVGPITEEQLTFEDFVQSDQNRPEEFQEVRCFSNSILKKDILEIKKLKLQKLLFYLGFHK